MADKIKFWPIRGTYDQIMAQPYYDGKLYFATDTNQIVLDANGSKHIMGGSGATGSGIIYAHGTESQIKKVSEDDGDFNYTITIDALDNSAVEPQKDALILNTDGRFFRVESVNSLDGVINVVLLAVSGSGGGGGSQTVADITLTYDAETINNNFTFIEGKSQYASFIATSETDNVVYLQFSMYESWAAYNNGKGEPIKSFTRQAESGEPYMLNMAEFAAGSGMVLRVVATAPSSRIPEGVIKVLTGIDIVAMSIRKYQENGFIGITTADSVTGLVLQYIPFGTGLTCTLHVSVDNAEIDINKTLVPANIGSRQSIAIPTQSHGMHTVALWLGTELNGEELFSEKITFEAAWADGESTVPIIWFGDYNDTVIQYENAVIPYMVYNPVTERNGLKTSVNFKKNNVVVSTQEVQYGTNWLTFDATAFYDVGINNFIVNCGVASQDVSFVVTTEGARDLNLVNQDAIVMNFSSLGRSNSETAAARKTWTSGAYTADFTGFNWYNNGWRNDNDGEGSYLSIANDARLTIPFGTIGLNGTVNWTFEMRFRVRNIQKYSTLVTSIPLYKYYTTQEAFDAAQLAIESGNDPSGMNQDGTELSIDEMNTANGNTALRGPVYWLAYDKYGNPAMNERNTTRKTVEVEKGVAVKYLNNSGYGFCIGTQEAYFRSPSNVTNVRYKEDEIINISFVVSGSEGEQKLYMYLNGILSGAENLNNTNVFDMQNVSFIFSSQYCDFDLYKFRIYRTALTMPEIIHNYISDCRNVSLYDENQLTGINEGEDTELSYDRLVAYNAAHPENPSMPYAIWKINDTEHVGDDRLPFIKKGGTRICDVTFVNPWLDKALADGTITEEFYYNHSPSYTATGVTIDVQGTSSQGYPRRNYKTKFKSAKDNWVYTQGSLAGLTLNANQTLENGTKISKKWHMDNPYCATNKFTWKIDYMESSGSYNTGFANLMGNNLYNKHPLEDLYPEGNFSAYRTSVYGFPVLVFHEYADGRREYIGRYNMNLDKGSNEYYGFEEGLEQPYVTLTRDVVDEETGAVSQETYHPAIADVAECWELRDNQGTWCSWRFPAGYNDFSRTTNGQPDGDLEVLQHFEYRYNNQEDEIDAAIDKTSILDDGTDISGIIGSTGAAMNAWLRNKLSNLERLFIWLDSTDTSKATGDALDTPVTYSVDRQVTDDNTIDYVVNEGGSITATFNNDTVEYRLQKFKAEFDQHLDRHYCTIYFIMTELLLCYDSRGKNMMISTFGPHREGGEYIWYPIFYDIDTQLGLNNVGALLWDYNEDATENQTFSTSTSVLWTNFYKMFMIDIRTVYATLRQNKLTYQTIEGAYTCNPDVFTESYAMKGKRPIIAIGLDEYVKYIAPIKTGYYDTSGSIQTGSLGDYLYACQGDRKLSRELFLINRLNYMDSKWQAGDYIVENAKQQIYMRVNVNATGTSDIYLDRESCDGVLPATARAEQVLADYPVPYLDARPEFTITPYLSQYVTTFVDDVRLTTSEAYTPVKYPNGMPSAVPAARLSEYKKETKQQEINYLPAGDFLSSMGDLSTQYLDSIGIYHGKRLLDITLGSDVPGYYNDLAGATTGTIWTFGDGIDSTNKKTLLKKVILTGLRNLSTAVDLRGSEKLQEYRALNTKIPYVTFADGCPLNTVHLPSYTAELHLNGNKNLNKILRNTPQVVTMNDGVATYNDHTTYEGLYIEGITDYNFPQDYDFKHPVLGANHALEYIEIADDALGYDSYEILRNAVVLKYNSDKINRGYLKVQMNNVHWSPYTLVPYGESYDSSITYYRLNEHSKFEEYTEGNAGWENGTLNEKIYTYDATANKSLITNLDMFDLFLQDMADVKDTTYLNQYRNISRDSVKSYPTITGEIYIDNSDENENAIVEDELTTKYGVAWPNLKITAAKVSESFLGKYIVLEDSGKESEYDVIRYSPIDYEGKPITLTSKLNPSKGNTYDFIGWATDIAGENIVFDAEGNMTEYGQNYTFNAASRTVITLYAIFVDHQFTVTFKNAVDSTTEVMNSNDQIIGVKRNTYGNVVTAPGTVPTILAIDDSTLGLTETYRFKGYTRLRTNTLVKSQTALKRALVDLSAMPLTEDVTLYACYMLQSVYDEATSSEYFTFTPRTSDGISGYQIDLNPDYTLNGKITLPSYYNGLPVVAMGYSFTKGNLLGNNTEITHIFWKSSATEPCTLRELIGWLDANNLDMKLKYIQLPEGLKTIGRKYFMSMYCIETITSDFEGAVENSIILPSTITDINDNAFNGAFKIRSLINLIRVPSSTTYLGNRAFGNLLCSVENLEIGTLKEGSDLTRIDNKNILDGSGSVSGQIYNHGSGITTNMTFYYKTTVQRTGFEAVESYFSNIENKYYEEYQPQS